MQRRDFILRSAAAATAIVSPFAGWAAQLDYTPGLLQPRLDAGETILLDFKASWCSTCRAQGRVLTKLKRKNPAYEANITFINVDWDTYGQSDIVARMNIPRRSTLVVLKGDAELGRIVAQTREATIKDLLDTALNAATAA